MKKIFIGSSNAAKAKADLLKKLLIELGADVSCWFDLGVFLPGGITIDCLLKQTCSCHGAIFVFDKDDETKSNVFIPRDNVVYEAGLFAGALGKEAVVICLVPGVQQITDLRGVTYLEYNPEARETMKESLRLWLMNNVRDDRPAKSENNLLMKSRGDIHERYTIEDRLHLGDGGYRHIRKIRVMNLASTFILNPDFAAREEIQKSKSELADAFQEILKEKTVIEMILPEPHPANLRGIATQIANAVAENPVYIAWEAIYNNISNNGVYRKAYDAHRFLCFSLNIGMPYAVFGVEFDSEYRKFDHVKIDLYSSGIGNEGQRRSFIIWRDLDPENYQFFVDNFDSIKQNSNICQQLQLSVIQKWLRKKIN